MLLERINADVMGGFESSVTETAFPCPSARCSSMPGVVDRRDEVFWDLEL
jgi:hypothetical protein